MHAEAYSPEKRHETHVENYSPEKRHKMHVEHYSAERQAETYSPEKRHEMHVENYSPEKRHKMHVETYNAGRQAEIYNSEKRHNSHMKNKQKRQDKSSAYGRLQNFRHECQFGPIFTCISCKRNLFERGVKRFKDVRSIYKCVGKAVFKRYLQSFESIDENSPLIDVKKSLKNSKSIYINSLKVNGNLHICHNCLRYLKKSEMPPLCWKNSLNYGDIPDSLKLSNIEKQLIVKSLLFIKVRKLPVTRMDAMNDRVINVAIEDDDIIKEVTSLPRTEKNCGMITVGLKRMLDMKNYHKLGLIRPVKVYEALLFLKKHHPEYENIDIIAMNEWIQQYTSKEEENSGKEGERSTDSSDESSDNSQNCSEQCHDASIQKLPDPENLFTSVTCLLPEEPLNDVIGKFLFTDECCIIILFTLLPILYFLNLVNTTGKTLKKKPKILA